MKHRIRAAKDRFHSGLITDVHMMKLNPVANLFQIGLLSCKEIVYNDNFPTLQQIPDQSGADETGAPGHYKFRVRSHEVLV